VIELSETWLKPQTDGIPNPRTTLITKPFWDGCDDGELRYQHCEWCGAAIFNPAHLCRLCQSRDLRWAKSRGLGTVYSYTICHRPMSPQFTTPYAPIIVDLDEGYQMLSNLIECDVGAVRVGMRVKVCFVAVGDRSMPYFSPA
jgi:uncharacterized OB-fold protein